MVADSQRTCTCSHYVLPLRNPWSCIFCSMEIIQERCSENQQRHQESEVLKRQMLHEEKLVSWNVNLEPLPFCLVETSSTGLQGAGGMVSKGKLLSLCCALVTWPNIKISLPKKISIPCLFHVYKFGSCVFCLSIHKSSFSPSDFSLKISSVFCRNVSSSSWRSTPVQKAPFLPQNHTM